MRQTINGETFWVFPVDRCRDVVAVRTYYGYRYITRKELMSYPVAATGAVPPGFDAKPPSATEALKLQLERGSQHKEKAERLSALFEKHPDFREMLDLCLDLGLIPRQF